MRDKALAVDCPARDPDPVLLMQLTARAAASTVPAVKPWWHRFTVKTGAAAVAGVLLISGATADAEHGKPTPIAVTIVGSTPASIQPPRHKLVMVTIPRTSYAVLPSMVVPMHHAWKRAHHHQHAHNKKHQDGNRNRGDSANKQGVVQFARLVTTQVSALPMQASPGHPHPHAPHSRQRANSHH